jgi:hypothetical protein
VERAPTRFRLTRSPEAIIAALTTGAIRQQATGLNTDQMHSLAVFSPEDNPARPATSACELCKDAGAPIDLSVPWNGWGLIGEFALSVEGGNQGRRVQG